LSSQIRTWEVLDPVILDLLMRVHREDFVPAAHRALAFADMELPLGHGEVMLSPKTEARMLQSLMIKNTDSVLEIGTGKRFHDRPARQSRASGCQRRHRFPNLPARLPPGFPKRASGMQRSKPVTPLAAGTNTALMTSSC